MTKLHGLNYIILTSRLAMDSQENPVDVVMGRQILILPGWIQPAIAAL